MALPQIRWANHDKRVSRQDAKHAKHAKKNLVFILKQRDIRQTPFIPWRALRLGESNIIF
jgi:hypothetical protein